MGALDGAETGNLAEASAGLSIAASRNDFYQISILVYTEMNTNTHTYRESRLVERRTYRQTDTGNKWRNALPT